MYKITKNGSVVGLTGQPTHIRLMENGCYGLCSEQEAQGVAFNGTPYQLDGKSEMGGLEVVTMAEENDATISSDHTAAAQVFVEQCEKGNISEEEAKAHKGLFPLWSGDSVKVYDGTDGEHPQTWMRGITSGLLYKCNIGHTTQDDWPPEETPALWALVNESNKGTIDDPIPAERGMEYTYGLYYLDPEDGRVYLCQRGDETGGIVLQYLPHELTGNYFTLVE